jgi:hypothetical protein
MSQPIPRQPSTPQPRRQPKVIVNNSPALDAIAHIANKPFLGRFIYEPGWIIPASATEDAVGGKFELRIAHRFLNRDNEGVIRRKLWGSGVYTDDSDAVASNPLYKCILTCSSLPPTSLNCVFFVHAKGYSRTLYDSPNLETLRTEHIQRNPFPRLEDS